MENNFNNEEKIVFRKAETSDSQSVWEIIQMAIERRRQDGSAQWQNGYPNLDVVNSDILNGYCYVLEIGGRIAATSTLIFNDEPAYNDINGKWLSDGDFLVIHRVAISDDFAGRGLVKKMFLNFEDFAKGHGVYSIKVDTNYDNGAMLAILEKLGYTYCGEVYLAGGKRKAFEKLLV